MKVTHYETPNITFVLPHICTGGAEKVVIDLLIELKSQNLTGELIVLGSKNDNYFTKRLENNNIKVTYCEVSGRLSLLNYMKVAKVLKNVKSSFLSVHLDKRYSLVWALLNKCKVVYTIHSSPERMGDFATKILFSTMSKLNLIRFIGVSELIAKETKALFKLPSDYVIAIVNPVSLGNSISCTKKSEIVNFISVARLTAIKNQSLLIDAFCEAHKKNADISLQIAGQGEEYNNLEKQINKNHANGYIKLLGEVTYVDKFLLDNDVFLLTSDSEALPISILEAMAAGLPIISSNVGGISEIVTDNGILFERKNKEQLVNAILYLASNEEIRWKMASKSIDNVKQYSVDKVLQKYLTFFKEFFYDKENS